MKRYKLKKSAKGIKVLWVIDTFTKLIVKEFSPFKKSDLELANKFVIKLNTVNK